MFCKNVYSVVSILKLSLRRIKIYLKYIFSLSLCCNITFKIANCLARPCTGWECPWDRRRSWAVSSRWRRWRTWRSGWSCASWSQALRQERNEASSEVKKYHKNDTHRVLRWCSPSADSSTRTGKARSVPWPEEKEIMVMFSAKNMQL